MNAEEPNHKDLTQDAEEPVRIPKIRAEDIYCNGTFCLIKSETKKVYLLGQFFIEKFGSNQDDQSDVGGDRKTRKKI